MPLTLRDDQDDAIDDLRYSIQKGHKRIVMQAPTGFGKTLLSAQIVANALSKGKRVIFVVPAISLIDQTVEMFYRQGITDVGVIQAKHPMTDYSKPVQIASVQTLQRRNIPRADVVLIDEVHHWFALYARWILDPAWQSVPFIGLSATPWTKGLGEYFTDFIKASTTQELIDRGLLSPFRVFAPSHPDLSKVRTVAGDYHEGDLSEVMNDKVLVADIVRTWVERGENRPTLCFAVDRKHAQLLQERFIAAGVPCGYQDAFNDNEDKVTEDGRFIEGRKNIKRKFHSGEYKVVCNVGTLTTGVDWDVRCIILARPTKSEKLFVQIIGRGLRTAPGKDYCLILDHSDTHLRMGFVTDVDGRHDGLDDGKKPENEQKTKEEQIKPPKECPSCGYLKPPKCAKCPNCGFVAQMVGIEEKLKEGKGDLKELTNTTPSKTKATMEEKMIFLGELKAYATSKGYQDGWALNKYREKFGVWPDYSVKNVGPVNPSMGTLSWIKSRQIAWAKSKRNKAA